MANRSSIEHVVRLRLDCMAPPPEQHAGENTEFGLQDKKRVLKPGRRQADGSARFEVDVLARLNAQSQAVAFGGPFVHGTPDSQFLYLGWRNATAEPGAWIRRAKVLLRSITWEHVEQMHAQPGRLLHARVSGMTVATPPLLGDGWVVEADN